MNAPYEPRRFASTVAYYERYRLGYPERLIARVAGLARLRPGDAVLDLGAGTGMLAVGFANIRTSSFPSPLKSPNNMLATRYVLSGLSAK